MADFDLAELMKKKPAEPSTEGLLKFQSEQPKFGISDMAANISGKSKPEQKKVVATVLSQASGSTIKPKEVTPKNFEMAKAIADKSEDPESTAKVIQDKADSGEEISSSQKIYLALAAALPTVIGAAIGGAQGGAIGANTTGKFFGDVSKSLGEDAQKKAELANKLEVAKAASLEKAQAAKDQRDFLASQEDQRRQLSRENNIRDNSIRREDRANKSEEKSAKLEVPGYGIAQTEDDAKKLKDGIEEKSNFDTKIDELIQLRTDKGGGAIFDREAVSRAKQLSKDLLLSYKNMAKLGVLSASDEKIINAIIPSDPLEFNSPLAAIQGQDPTLNNLTKFKSDSDKDFQTKLGLRIKGYKSPEKQQSQPKTVTQGGHTYTLNEQTGKYE